MAWLLFMDESGHDHRQMPGEVRGGVAIRADRLWDFVQDWKHAELEMFGIELSQVKEEIKGSKLLRRDKFKLASQGAPVDAITRRALSRALLEGQASNPDRKPTWPQMRAYGQANLATRIFPSSASIDVDTMPARRRREARERAL